MTKAEQVRAEIMNGLDFSAAALKYSDDTASASSGGVLGSVTMATNYVEEFLDAAFSLRVEQLSQPVKTSWGYHIIKVTKITPAHQQTLDDVKESIKSTLLDEMKNTAWQDWITKQKKELNVTYAEGMELTTTTTAGDASTTSTTSVDTSTTLKQ